jgi:ABC-type sugar transport system substrate-binding protein
VNAEEQRPTKIGPTEKIKGPIPTGKTIALVQCGVEDCIIQGNSLQQAADVLGWKLIRIPSGVTPETIKAGWDQALRDHPDAIVEGGFPHAYFKSEIAQALAEKIPVVGLTDPDPIAPPVIQNIGSQVYLTRLGQLFANWVGAHVQSGQIGQVTTSDLPTEVRQAGSFKARLAVVCPKCTIKTQNIPISTFGTTSAATIAGFYQANPNLAYSAMALADMGVGLPQALAGANVTAPLTVYASANPVTLGYMAKHQANLQADIVYSTVEVPWRAADALVRYWTHGDVSQDSDLTLPNWYLTPPNIPAAALKGPIPWVANYQQQYKALWGK